jgi:hypothetical protein
MASSMTVWFVIDSAVSIIAGVEGNAISNTAIYLTFITPIIAGGALGERRAAVA